MELEIKSENHTQIIDLTARVLEKTPDSHTGLCLVFVPHTTAGVIINEYERRLVEDLEEFLRTSIESDKEYKHDQIDENAVSHLRQTILGSSLNIPVENGELELGSWQSILFVELDGPRTREIKLKFI